MKLRTAIDEYIDARRAVGSPTLSSEATLQAFSRSCGDMALAELSAETISTYVSRPDRAPSTKASIFSGLKCFVDFQIALGRVEIGSLEPPPRSMNHRLPRVYTRAEVKLLLDGTAVCQARASGCDGPTLRLGLLLLYATGATVSETLQLRCSELQLRRRSICLGRGASERWLPISFHLAQQLHQSVTGKEPTNFVLSHRRGAPLALAYIASRFRRLTRQVGIRTDANGREPRLQDFRYTFAVHRIESWIQQKADLNVLIPALSTYMGYSDLLKAEEFLALTPEHFRDELNKLSHPQQKDKG